MAAHGCPRILCRTHRERDFPLIPHPEGETSVKNLKTWMLGLMEPQLPPEESAERLNALIVVTKRMLINQRNASLNIQVDYQRD